MYDSFLKQGTIQESWLMFGLLGANSGCDGKVQHPAHGITSCPDLWAVRWGMAGIKAIAPTFISWEFERGPGTFSRYGDDCQSYIERQYQEFLGGCGRSQVRVKTGN